MQRRSFLALLGLGVPAAAVAKTVAPSPPAKVSYGPFNLRDLTSHPDLGSMTAGILRSADGKVTIDLDHSSFTISS